MDNQWKEEYCRTCDFNINYMCRKDPPSVKNTDSVRRSKHDYYPRVSNNLPACSCWREGEYEDDRYDRDDRDYDDRNGNR